MIKRNNLLKALLVFFIMNIFFSCKKDTSGYSTIVPEFVFNKSDIEWFYSQNSNKIKDSLYNWDYYYGKVNILKYLKNNKDSIEINFVSSIRKYEKSVYVGELNLTKYYYEEGNFKCYFENNLYCEFDARIDSNNQFIIENWDISLFKTGFTLCEKNSFKNLQKIDTAKILGKTYNDVYKFIPKSFGPDEFKKIYYSKGIGFILIELNSGYKLELLP